MRSLERTGSQTRKRVKWLPTYYLDRYVETQSETEFIDFSEFIDTGEAVGADTLKLRFVTSDDDGAEIAQPESIMSDIPAGIRQRLEHCTELYCTV